MRPELTRFAQQDSLAGARPRLSPPTSRRFRIRRRRCNDRNRRTQWRISSVPSTACTQRRARRNCGPPKAPTKSSRRSDENRWSRWPGLTCCAKPGREPRPSPQQGSRKDTLFISVSRTARRLAPRCGHPLRQSIPRHPRSLLPRGRGQAIRTSCPTSPSTQPNPSIIPYPSLPMMIQVFRPKCTISRGLLPPPQSPAHPQRRTTAAEQRMQRRVLVPNHRLQSIHTQPTEHPKVRFNFLHDLQVQFLQPLQLLRPRRRYPQAMAFPSTCQQ